MIKNQNLLRALSSMRSTIQQISEKLTRKRRESSSFISQITPVLPNAKQCFGPLWIVAKPDAYGWSIEYVIDREPKGTEYSPGRVIIKYDPVEFRLLKELTPTWEGLDEHSASGSN